MLITGKTQKDIDTDKAITQATLNALEAQKLLTATDWYIVRKLEKSVDVPQEILDARDNARAIINASVVVDPSLAVDLTPLIQQISTKVSLENTGQTV